MQTQSSPVRKPKVNVIVQGPSGHEYILNPDGTFIDPETGIIYNPLAGLLIDPQTGTAIDLKTGAIMDAEGNIIGQANMADLYGFRPVTPTTSQTQEVTSPAQPPAQPEEDIEPVTSATSQTQQITSPVQPSKKDIKRAIVEASRRVGSRVIDVLARIGAVYYEGGEVESMPVIKPNPKGAEELLKRLMVAKDNLTKETAFMEQILDDLIDYVRYTGVDGINPKVFVDTVYPNADEETKRKIRAAIDFLWKAGIVPPKR